ncbi:methyltransferase domain-containing protein [Pseudomarimonas salicorniae]|uniref:Methyltransferase domain-containing protein n=1 Tax=Pseudomarimonas salicorniae TaxID=2933270 RepID=A0ABT0GIT3_9GAMM|nr:methyltransferase domain-containing protein [Lysobacter sp. CAU 1642]MCK7594455.1 methyltransferase domain-containing protein [Lysobacter sp. CAU 1642]
MSPEGPLQLDARQIAERIRAEITRRRSAVPADELFPTPEPLPASDSYLLADLLAIHDADFVRQAYLAILRREPDPSGLAHYTRMIREAKLTKVETLGRLRYSPEGRSRSVRIKGLLLPLAVQQVIRVPVIGYLLALAVALLRLPLLVRGFARLEAHTLWLQRQTGEAFRAAASAGDVHTERATRLERAARQAAAEVASLQVTANTHAQRLSAVESTAAQEQGRTSSAIAGLSRSFEEMKGEIEARVAALQASLATADEAAEIRSWMADLKPRIEQSLEGSVTLSRRMADLEDSSSKWALALDEARGQVRSIEAKANGFAEAATVRVSAAEARTLRVAERLGRLEEGFKANVSQLEADRAGAARHRREIATDLSDLVDALRKERNDREHLTEDLASRLSGLELAATSSDERVEATLQAIGRVRARLEEMQRQWIEQRAATLEAQRQISRLIDSGRLQDDGESGTATAGPDKGKPEAAGSLDAFYVDFEDRFRGGREEIMRRAAYYLPLLRKASAGLEEAPVLDIGCGRGELLELLSKEGMEARGIDLNTEMVACCEDRGLFVARAEALAYLSRTESGSLGAVTAMHVVEHLPFEQLVALVDECHRVLRPGGVMILETPNPENILVGSCYFYMDPTHRNPIPPALLQFIAEARGFAAAEIHRLSEHRGEPMVRARIGEDLEGAEQVNAVLGQLHHMLASAPDYAVVARKA